MSYLHIIFAFSSIFLIVVKCETFYQIGIYSNCTGKANRTELNKDADLVRDFNKIMFQRMIDYQQAYYSINYTHHFIYQEYDVCDNMTLLAAIVQNLTLNKHYKIQAENRTYSDSSIMDIFMDTSFQMVSFVKSTFTKIPIHNSDARTQTDGSVYDITDEATLNLVALVKYLGWKKLTLVTLTTFEYPFLVYYRKSVEALKNLNICLELYHIEPHRVNNETGFLKRMADSSELPVVVLYGSDRAQGKFMHQIAKWFPVIPFYPINHGVHIWPFDHLSTENDHLNFFSNTQEQVVTQIIRFNLFPTEMFNKLPSHLRYVVGENLFIYMLEMQALLVRLIPFRLDDFLKKFYYLRDFANMQRDEISKTNIFLHLGKKRFLRIGSIDRGKMSLYSKHYALFESFILSKNNSYLCKTPLCVAGHHRIYGNVTNGFGWKCVLCPENTYTSFSSYARTCQKCSGRFNIDNGKRTDCVDPYTNIHTDFRNKEFIFFVALNCFGVFLTIFSLTMFVIKRKTPIVSVSDYKPLTVMWTTSPRERVLRFPS